MGFNGITSASLLRTAKMEAGRSVSRLLEYSRIEILPAWIRMVGVEVLRMEQILVHVAGRADGMC